MGTGKTVVARLLAEKLGYRFVDTDRQIERYTKKSISDIFAQDGEAEFRRLEKLLLHWLIHYDRAVISSGGGMVANPDNLNELKQMGRIICLKATPEVILERIKNEPHRPLLHAPDPLSRIKELLARREACYAKADYRIDTSQLTTEQVADRIIEWLDKG